MPSIVRFRLSVAGLIAPFPNLTPSGACIGSYSFLALDNVKEVVTLLVKSRPLHFQEHRRALLHTTARVFLTFHCRMQGGLPGRF